MPPLEGAALTETEPATESTAPRHDGLMAYLRAQAPEVGRFLLVGSCAASADLAVYVGARHVVAPWLAKGLSFVAGATIAFIFNRGFVFRARRAVVVQIAPFAVLYATTLVLNGLVHEAAIVRHAAPMLAWFLATAASTMVNFLGMKFAVFRRRTDVGTT